MADEVNVSEVRACGLALLYHAGSGHPGGVLSSADILEVLWARSAPWKEIPEGRLILSKGHSVAALYALAGLSGMLDANEATSLRQIGSRLQGHGHVVTFPWLETSTGSLGQGFSFAVGLALGLRHRSDSTPVFAVLGDGELQEGQVWEAAMSAAHFQLDQLTVVIDHNGLQSDAENAKIMNIEPLAEKWAAFGWDVLEVDGHSTSALSDALDRAAQQNGRPSVIIAKTVKGKGVRFMEHVPEWHGSVRMTEPQLRDALTDLGVTKNRQDEFVAGQLWS